MSRTKRILKITALALAGLIGLLLFVVVAFVFSPFEGSVPDIRDAVPRDSQFFLRKVALDDDFVEVPEPLFWQDLTSSKAWQDLKNGPMVRGLARDLEIAKVTADIKKGLAEIRANSSGMFDPVADVLGEELIVSGRFQNLDARPAQLPTPWWCVFARVSWKVRAGWGLTEGGWLNNTLQAQGLSVEQSDNVLVLTGGQLTQPLFLARERDCLMISNGRPYLDQVLLLLGGGDETVEPLGRAAQYTEGVVAAVDRFADDVDALDTRAYEFVLRPNAIPEFQDLAQRWPNPNNPDSMNERVLESFINLKGWTNVSGALMFEDSHVSLTSLIDLNSNTFTAFQKRFFVAESAPSRRWLDDFLKLVPGDAAAAAALRVPAEQFLEEMVIKMDGDDRSLMNTALGNTGRYRDVRELIDQIGICLQPRIGFVFRKNVEDVGLRRDYDHTVANPEPVPQVAWVFWVRGRATKPIEDFLDTLGRYRDTFGFTHSLQMDMNLAGDGTDSRVPVVREFLNPQIAGTGSLATILFQEYFVIGNSGPLIRSMFASYYDVDGKGSILRNDAMAGFYDELPTNLNGFGYVQGSQMTRILKDYEDHSARTSAARPDVEWARDNRPLAMRTVQRRDYANYRTLAAMPDSVRNGKEFQDKVDLEVQAMWQRYRTEAGNSDLNSIREAKALFQMMEGAYFWTRLEQNEMELRARALLNFEK